MNKIAMLIASTTILMGSSTTSEQEHLMNYPYESFKKVVAWDTEMHKQINNKREINKDEAPVYEFDALVTAYCASETPEDDPTYGHAADGTKLIPGETISMGKSIPFGSVVEIQSLGQFIVHDRGRLIHQDHIDLLVKSSREVNNFGKRYLKAKIIKWGNGKTYYLK